VQQVAYGFRLTQNNNVILGKETGTQRVAQAEDSSDEKYARFSVLFTHYHPDYHPRNEVTTHDT
jgi:hypothetical protein